MYEAQILAKRFAYVLATLIALLLLSQLALRLQHSRLEKRFAADIRQVLDAAGLKVKGQKSVFGNLTGKEDVCQVASAWVVPAENTDPPALGRQAAQSGIYPYNSAHARLVVYRRGAAGFERLDDVSWTALATTADTATGDPLFDRLFAPYAGQLATGDLFLAFFDETAAAWDSFDIACQPPDNR